MGAVGLHADLSGMPSFRQVMQRVRKVIKLPQKKMIPMHSMHPRELMSWIL